MSVHFRNFTLTRYTNGTLANLVSQPMAVDCIIVTNTSGGSVNASIQLSTSAGAKRATLMSAKAIGAGESYTFEIPGFKVGVGDLVQATGSAAGLEFTASGEVI